MSCNASAPCTTVRECRANRSKNRSSLGRKARNQRSIFKGSVVEGNTGQGGLSHGCHGSFIWTARSPPSREHRSSTAWCSAELFRKRMRLKRTPEIMRDFTDDAAAERQHADHEDY